MAQVIVNNFAELKAALADATSTDILVNNDIQIEIGGAPINKNKGDITIDFDGHSVTDYGSSVWNYTLHVEASGVGDFCITMKNAVWYGRNFYGMCCVYDITYNQNVVLDFQNITYVGPQPVYNRYGLVRVTDSTFSLRYTGYSAEQEFCECNRLHLYGNVRIDKVSGYSTFWMTNSNTEFVVHENANVNVVTESSYVFYADGSETAMQFLDGCKASFVAAQGMWLYNSATLHMAQSLAIGQNCDVSMIQTGTNGTVPTFKSRGGMTVGNDSRLLIAHTVSSSASLVAFPVRCDLVFSNPKNVVFYNLGANVFSFSGGTTASPSIINIDAQLINLWTTAQAYANAGGFDDVPTRKLKKAAEQNISASFNIVSGALNSLSTNIVDGDEGYPVSLANFNPLTSRVFAFGNMVLEPSKVYDYSLSVNGLSEPDANMRVSNSLVTVNDVADGEGQFAVAFAPQAAGTMLSVGANKRFLTIYENVEVQGSVRIIHADELSFKTFVAPTLRTLVKRKNTDFSIQILDTRLVMGNDWQLFVSLPNGLSHEQQSLGDVLVFLQDDVTTNVAEIPVLVHTGSWQSDVPYVTTLTWAENEGFLLEVEQGYPYQKGHYTGDLVLEVVVAEQQEVVVAE